MIIDERSGSTVAVVRKVGGLISAAWPVRTDEPPHQGTSLLDVPEDEDVPPTGWSTLSSSVSIDGGPDVAASQHEVAMSLTFENDKEETARRERTIRSLTDGAGASVEHIRRLFAAEFARLGKGARVRKFLHVLTTSKVRQMLRSASKPRRME
jgi:Protein of unknown function (DUF3562)